MRVNLKSQFSTNKQHNSNPAFGTRINISDKAIELAKPSERQCKKLLKLCEKARDDGRNMQLNIVAKEDTNFLGDLSISGDTKTVYPGIISFFTESLFLQVNSIYKKACKIADPILKQEERSNKLIQDLKELHD